MKYYSVYYLRGSCVKCNTYTTTNKQKAIKLFWYWVDRFVLDDIELLECREVYKNEL